MAEARTYKSKDVNGNDVELRFIELNQVVLTRGDFIYREYFSKALRSGVITNAEALKILRDREIWTEADEKRLVDLQVELYNLESKLKEFEKRDVESMGVYDEIKRVRRQTSELSSVRSNVMDNTAESMASEMRTQFFASECAVYNTSGKKVFSSLQDFLDRLDEPLATASYRQALIMNYEKALGITLPSDPQDSRLPEDDWIITLKDKEIAEEEQSTKKPTKKPAKKPAKKRRTKKKTTATK